MRSGVKQTVFMVLHRTHRHRLSGVAKFIGVAVGHQSKNRREGDPQIDFLLDIRSTGNAGRNFLRLPMGHLFHSANQHKIIKPGRNCHQTLAESQAARSTSSFGPDGRNVAQSQLFGNQWAGMTLQAKIGTVEIPQIQRLQLRFFNAGVPDRLVAGFTHQFPQRAA